MQVVFGGGHIQGDALSPPAIGAVSNLLLQSLLSSFDSHLEDEAGAISQVSAGAEAKEGVEAFLQKRRPDFRKAQRG